MSLERVETPIAYCSAQGKSLQFDQCFRAFLIHLASVKFL